MKVSIALLLLSIETASCFTPSPSLIHHTRTHSPLRMTEGHSEVESFDPLNLSSSPETTTVSPLLPIAAATTALLATPSIASAAGPDWGIFEGRTGSLLHPITMGSMLLLSLSTAVLGFAWRRQRTIGDDISVLKKRIPSYEGSSISEAIAAAEAEEDVNTAYVSSLRAALPIEAEVKELTATRKELSSQGNRDKHFNQGALLAFIGTSFAIEGPLNTYARAGKLFPGPHLYAGAGLVVLWAAAASCVPHMQRGNDTARTIHIAANLGGIGLFAWQVTSGWPILLKVIELTKWP